MEFVFSAQELKDLYEDNRNIKKEVINISKEILTKGGTIKFSKIPNIPPLITVSSKDEFKDIEKILNEYFITVEKDWYVFK